MLVVIFILFKWREFRTSRSENEQKLREGIVKHSALMRRGLRGERPAPAPRYTPSVFVFHDKSIYLFFTFITCLTFNKPA